jgi:hypothetical protein
MLTRLIFWALIVYLAYRLITRLVLGPPRRAEQNKVQGKAKNRPLDLSNLEVEDAKFEEIKEKSKNNE